MESKPILFCRCGNSKASSHSSFLRGAARRVHAPHAATYTRTMADARDPPPPAGPGPSSTAAAEEARGAAAPLSAEAAPAPVLFKRPAGRARGNLRRGAGAGGGGSDGEDNGGAATSLAKRPRPSAAAPLVASTRDARPPPSSTVDAAVPARFGGDRSLQSGRDELATAQLETETEFDRDNR